MKKERKIVGTNEVDPPPQALTQDYFNVQIQRLEQAFLDPTKRSVEGIEKSVKMIKTCVQLVCAALLGAAVLYIITAIINLINLLKAP